MIIESLERALALAAAVPVSIGLVVLGISIANAPRRRRFKNMLADPDRAAAMALEDFTRAARRKDVDHVRPIGACVSRAERISHEAEDIAADVRRRIEQRRTPITLQ